MARNHERLGRIREAAERVAGSYGLEIFDVQLRREPIGISAEQQARPRPVALTGSKPDCI